MSVIQSKKTTKAEAREPDQYEGLWLNPSIAVGDEDNPKYVRFNRGVALSDLRTRKLYETMDPDFAAEQSLVNERIEAILERGLELGEGESIVVNIPLVLYRKMEEAVVAPTAKADKAKLRSELFD